MNLLAELREANHEPTFATWSSVGTTAVVYKVFDTLLERPRALKVQKLPVLRIQAGQNLLDHIDVFYNRQHPCPRGKASG